MKKIIMLFLAFLFVSNFYAQTNSALKIGYIDSEIILSQYSEAVKAKSDLDALVAKWRATLDSMATDYQNEIANYQKQSNTMTPEKQREAQQKILEKEQKIQNFRDQKFSQPNGEYFTQQDKIMAPVKKKIFDVINQIAKEEGMQFVFDKAGDVVLLYADPQYDITYKVLDRLKRGK
ncbi:OmpH family outer membrane protein [Melioribacteraceae bacterium 4301-Me]|uniref:OmpH family outer membrane protein n=1 Tax=Pyranulibacter aquaticus TaxID=3163344 RepID=UPI0035981B70